MKNSPEKNISQVNLGICAMEKKSGSKAMKSILENLSKFKEFNIIIFSEEIIFKSEIEKWPIVDALIIFFSDGFPFNKGLKYINLRKPFLVNDFEIQKVFWDRVKVLQMLEEEGIPIPNHIIIDRGGEINNDGENTNNSGELNTSAEKEKKVKTYKKEINYLIKENRINDLKMNLRMGNNVFQNSKTHQKIKSNSKNSSSSNSTKNYNSNNEVIKLDELIEFDDHIEYKGKKLYKPFVEKPFNGDDHNIYIYYPPNLGGGHKRLFRKTKEYSSLYFPNLNKIRRDKSYIYEEFLQSDGFDVKVYTIGKDYAHAEERKSPTLDGKVNRSIEGKEVRYPINLTEEEKEFAKKIVMKFKQNICGFDILRCQGNSYVCDVNGFSFVKGNQKYYKDCSNFLRKYILHGLKKDIRENNDISTQPIFPQLKIHSKHSKQLKSNKIQEELRSIVAVFRHGDRSPKEKMKLIVEDSRLLSLFDEFGKNNSKKEIKLKKANELKRVLEIVNEILSENKQMIIGEDNFYTRIFQIKMVLERKIHFDGLTRKIQMKPLSHEEIIEETTGKKVIKITKALLILKWGGSLTHAGIEQAYKLGRTFLCTLYPSNQEKEDGLIRLHLTYRHDLKCYSADEGRCLKTSASFLKGLLKLDGPIIPIISSMVRQDEEINKLLDDSESIHEFKGKIKEKLSECLNYDGNLKDKFYSLFKKESVFPEEDYISDENENEIKSSTSSDDYSDEINGLGFKENKIKKNLNKKENPLDALMERIGNPLKRLKQILSLMKKVIKNIQSFLSNDNDSSYFITDKSQILKREYDVNINKQKLIEKILGEDLNKKETNEGIDLSNINERKFSEKKIFKLEEDNIENIENENYDSETIKILNEENFDCKDEQIILIYKRYVKLKNDFFNQKKNLFDISKIPDIYDNIKYDIIHNKNLINESGYQLFDEISLLANFVMPLEYGITKEEKINIGLKIIKPLLKKIHSDLNVILQPNKENNDTNSKSQKEDKNWSGLDTAKVNDNEIKSLKRHVKSRFYFTCASHMYALLNIIGNEYDSLLTHKNKKVFEKLKSFSDLDYCSHVIFRLFENLNDDVDNPNRFRLEIIMSPGSSSAPIKANKNHLINVSNWIVLNENLNRTQMKEFLNKFK